MDPQKRLGTADVLIEISARFYLQNVLCVQIRFFLFAGQRFGEEKGVPVHRRQKRHDAAPIAFFGWIREHEVRLAQLQPAYPQHRAVVSLNGDHQQHRLFPGVGETEKVRPDGAFRQPLHRAAQQFIVAGHFGSVKLQFPAIVKLQLMVPGHIRNAAVKHDVLIRRAFAAQIGKSKIEPGAGELGCGRLGVGGGVQNQKSPAAGG